MRISKVTKRGRVMWMAYDTANGKRVRRFFKTRSEADAYLDQWHEDRSRMGKEWARVSVSDRAEMMTAWTRATGRGYSLHQACDAFERAIEGTKTIEVSVANAVSEYIGAKRKQNLKPYTLTLLEASLDRLTSHFRETPISAVDIASLERYLDARNGSPKSRKNWIGELSGLWRWCEARNYVRENVAAKISKPIVTRATPKILSVDECRSLLNACMVHDRELLSLVAICLFAGLRTGECMQIGAEQIDTARGIITVSETQAKGRSRRVIPISDNLCEWLRVCPPKQPISERIDSRLIAMRDRAQIKHWPRNAMRHSFCSYHLALHGSAAKTAIIAGHSETMLFRHYRDICAESDARDFFSITPKS